MKFLTLQFSARVYTNIGEQVYICGNISDLGHWEPSKGLKLYTDPNMYPNWSSFRSIHVRESTSIEFKLCVLSYHGQVIRWEFIPNNSNRKIVASMNMSISFHEGIQDLQLAKIQPSPRLSFRNKVHQILNDLDSDSSSSKQFWNECIEDEEGPLYQRNIRASMKRIIESQSEEEIQLKFNEEGINPTLVFNEPSNDYTAENYFLLFEPNDQMKEYQNNDHTIFIKKSDGQSYQKIKFLSNVIASQRQDILVAHMQIQLETINMMEEVLKMGFQWKTVVHMPKNNLKECLKIIQCGVNLIVLDDMSSLQQVFTIFSLGGYRPKMVKPLLYVLQLRNYRRTYIFCGNSTFKEYFLDSLTQNDKILKKINKINDLLFIDPNLMSQPSLMRNLLNKQKNILSKVKNGKRVIVLTIQNIKMASSKIIKSLIQISGLRNHEVYILQQQKIIGIERSLPITNKDKLMVISSDGQIYASGQRSQSIYDTLTLSPRRFQQMYDTIIKSVGADSHCQIKSTKKNTLIIQFTADEIGQCVKKFILNSVLELNMKSLSKVIVINKDQINTIQIKPYCLSTDFYIKSIINGALKAQYTNSLLLCVDYFSQQKSLNLFERNLKNVQNIVYQGFYCQRFNNNYSNCCKPIITEQNLSQLLSLVIQESKNTPWMRSPLQTNQTDVE